MFSVEIKVNTVLVGHLYAYNAIDVNDIGQYKYFYCYYSVQERKTTEGEVWHKRENGIEELVRIIFTDMQNSA